MIESRKILFEDIYVKFHYRLRYLARNYRIPSEDVDDIVQETFYAFMTHYPANWEDRRVRSLLIKILRNKCIDYYRMQKKKALSIDEVSETVFSLMNMNMDPEEIFIRNESRQETRRRISKLRRSHQEVIIMYYFEKKKTEEICDILDITEYEFYARLKRARKKLFTIVCDNNIIAATGDFSTALILCIYIAYENIVKRYN